MKILYILTHYYPYIKGGAEISTSYIISEDAKNNTPIILTSRFQKKPWKHQGVSVFPYLYQCSIGNRRVIAAIRYGVSIVINPLRDYFIVKSFINKHKIDLVQITPSNYYQVPIILAAIKSHLPVVIDIRDYSLICPTHLSSKRCANNHYKKHGVHCLQDYQVKSPILQSLSMVMAWYESLIFKLYIKLAKDFINSSDNVILTAVSEYVKQQLIDNGYKSDKIYVVYNFIDPSLAVNIDKKRSKQIVYAGRLETSKGVWDIIHAVERLRDKSIKLVIAGTGSQLERIRAYIGSRPNLPITLVGKLNTHEVMQLYADSALVIAPSRWPEPFGRFIIESVLTNTPLISCNVGGIPEIIEHNKTGILVPPQSPTKLAQKIRQLLTDQQEYKRILRNMKSIRNKLEKNKILKTRKLIIQHIVPTY